ncbi:anti-sigma factor domain-containing protein [Mesorhizobium sp. SP-1A]|uniref:anti-sigma factor n=1 Tax=Mesorhizobium sp. SP-1A TaxID=3077840 RepID=UPI0028F7475F|nr:anti-sigma factor [Mesorhizobium sp. SP-1A]
MTLARDDGPERGDDDIVAAEYVLGVLTADERRAAALRIEADADFARLVDRWENRLAPLANAYEAVEAPAGVKATIDRRLFAGNAAVPERADLWSSLAFWRGLAAAAVAALVLYAAIPYMRPPAPQQAGLVASLAAQDSDVKYLAVYDAARNEIRLSHVSGDHASGRDFELWVIEGKTAPVSAGVIPAGTAVQMAVKPDMQGKLAQGAVLAISVEPTGGSPTGQPTGPVVAAGDLKSL